MKIAGCYCDMSIWLLLAATKSPADALNAAFAMGVLAAAFIIIRTLFIAFLKSKAGEGFRNWLAKQ